MHLLRSNMDDLLWLSKHTHNNPEQLTSFGNLSHSDPQDITFIGHLSTICSSPCWAHTNYMCLLLLTSAQRAGALFKSKQITADVRSECYKKIVMKVYDKPLQSCIRLFVMYSVQCKHKSKPYTWDLAEMKPYFREVVSVAAQSKR